MRDKVSQGPESAQDVKLGSCYNGAILVWVEELPQPSHLSRSGLGYIIVHDRQSPVAVMFQFFEGTIQYCPNVLWSEGTDSRDGGPLPGRVTG